MLSFDNAFDDNLIWITFVSDDMESILWIILVPDESRMSAKTGRFEGSMMEFPS